MKNIAILVPETAVIEAVADPRYMFTAVNEFIKSQATPALFNVELVGLTKEVKLADGIFSIHTDATLKTAKKPDLIIIPAISGNLEHAIKLNKDFIPWIVKQYKNGAEVASLCLGAFILASTGLIDGKKCATHWMAETAFRKMFPGVNLVTEQIITDEQGIYSSGGAFSYMNLILYLIEKYAGREIAVLSAKVFAIEIDRHSQSPFIMFQGQKEHSDEPIKDAQTFIENN